MIPHEVKHATIGEDSLRFTQTAKFERWFSYPALTVEELAALSCDREPEVLKAHRIGEFKRSILDFIWPQQDVMSYWALARGRDCPRCRDPRYGHRERKGRASFSRRC